MGDSAQTIINKHKFLDGKGLQKVWEKTKHHYAQVADNTSAIKVIDCPGFTLYAGAIISIDFLNGNKANNVKFNINNTGAKDVFLNSDDALGECGQELFVFVYDGLNFVCIGRGDTTIYIE